MLLILLMALAGVLIWFLPVEIRVEFRQMAWQADLRVEVKAPLVKVKTGRSVNISDKVLMALVHILRRWRSTGEPVKIPLQKTIRRWPRKKILRVVGRPILYLSRRMRCKKLVFGAVVGGFDAMESALLAGAIWSAVGNGIGLLSQRMQMERRTPMVNVVPSFGGPAWRVQSDCIVRFRLGHAIVAGIWLLRRALREKELVAWARDSWRRKGVEGSGRASDSRPDEDGHGEP